MQANSLFTDGFSNEQTNNSSVALRTRAVNVDTGQLVHATNARVNADGQSTGASASISSSVTINLFDDAIVTADLTKTYTNKTGSTTWIGEIEGQEKSAVIFVIQGDQVYGLVESQQGNYSIHPTASSSAHVIEQIRYDAVLSGESDFVIPPQLDSSNVPEMRAVGSAPEDDGSLIDVYVAYDQDASGGAVAQADAQHLAELFIAYTNTAYKNSGINQRVWLVGNVDGYDYTDPSASSLSADLNAIQNGSIAGLHDKRDEYHADLVLFFTPHSGNACGGFAYLQSSNNDIDFEAYAFGVMGACSFGNTIFAHELGHNMGSRHGWYMDDEKTPQTYAHGYIDIANNFRTIMSYANRCSALGISCSPIAHFSNPAVNHNGNKTGVTGGTSAACIQGDVNPSVECDADNGRNFNEKAATTAKFRDGSIVWTGAAGTDWSVAANWVINLGKPSARATVNRVPRSYDNAYIPAGLSNYPTITGTAEARGVTIASGATLNMTGGTLAVGWDWNDAGGFNATGGTVKFISPLDIEINSVAMSAAASSVFHHVEIGSGADSTTVALGKSIDINGNLTIQSGATFKANSHTINLAGNWDDQASGFSAGTGTVVFDGSAQTADKQTASTLISENFSAYTSCGCQGTGPAGWTQTGDGTAFLYGALQFGNGEAVHWDDSTNAWLFTKAVQLNPGVNYSLSFSHTKDSSSTSSYSIAYGNSQSAAAMAINIGSIDNAGTSASAKTKTISFTVNTSGTYYIGINSQKTAGFNRLDKITLIGNQNLAFYNATIDSGETDFLKPVAVSNILEIAANAVADFGANAVSVEGVVTNNGSIKQTKIVTNGTAVEFARIKNAGSSSNKYFGVEITPTTGDMGSTIVEVKGNQSCAAATLSGIKRCNVITPATDQSANITYYYRSAEANGNSAPKLYLLSGGTWGEQAASTVSGSGDAIAATVTGITSYGTFALADSLSMPTPTADGDVGPLGSRDGVVNIGDAVVALRYALGIVSPIPADDLVHGDVAPLDNSGQPDPNGVLNIGDAVVILRKALNIISF